MQHHFTRADVLDMSLAEATAYLELARRTQGVNTSGGAGGFSDTATRGGVTYVSARRKARLAGQQPS